MRFVRRFSWQWCVVVGLCVCHAVLAHASPPSQALPADWLSSFINRHGLGIGLFAVFVGGLLLNFTPCVYPMIPVTIAFFTGQAAGALGRATLLAWCYVVGMSVSYAILGAVAASTGALLGSWLQQPAVLIGIAVVMVVLSLSMFGLYDLRPPQAIIRRIGHAPAGLGGAFLMGVVVGLVAAPCIGPFVLGLMLFVSTLGNPAAGFLLFFVLGLGMGLPYVVLGLAAHRVGHLPKAGAWLVWGKKVLGVVLLGLALYFVKPLLPARVWPRPQAVAAITWRPYRDAALEQAQREGRPILIDIYADWCVPCVEMDHVTFRHPDVVNALSQAATFRLDVTLEVPAEGERLLERYRIFGAPTVLFFDRSGTERRELRLLGFATPQEFLERLSNIQ